MSKHITVAGAPEGFDAQFILQEIAKSGKPVCHIARDDKRLAAMQAALAFFAPDMPVIVFPGWDCLPYDRVSPNADVSAARMATLAALVHEMPGQYVLLTSLNAATQRVPARSVLREAAFTAAVGKRIDEEALRAFLVRMGFTQSPTVMEAGDYAIRGGIIDIFPPGQDGPIRLDLFGDTLDGARRFDPVSQRTTEKLTEIELAPVSEVILDEAAITRFRQNYRIEFGAIWKRCLITCPTRRFHLMIRSRRRGWCAGTRLPINTAPASMRCSRRGGWTVFINPRRLNCCIWTIKRGSQRLPITVFCNLPPMRKPLDRVSLMQVRGRAGILRQSGSKRRSAFSAALPVT